MAVKVLGIGNKLMRDDGLGVRVIESLKDKLTHLGVEVIIGETDVSYCLNRIQEGDFLIIVDVMLGRTFPGKVNVIQLNELEYFPGFFSSHQLKLPEALKVYFPNTSGVFIGIEVLEVSFGLSLSTLISKMYEEICQQVFCIIRQILIESKE